MAPHFVLSEYDITYVTQKAIKGQVIADHLASHPLPSYAPVRTDFPDEDVLFATEDEHEEWSMYFDGAFNDQGSGAGIVLVSPGQKGS